MLKWQKYLVLILSVYGLSTSAQNVEIICTSKLNGSQMFRLSHSGTSLEDGLVGPNHPWHFWHSERAQTDDYHVFVDHIANNHVVLLLTLIRDGQFSMIYDIHILTRGLEKVVALDNRNGRVHDVDCTIRFTESPTGSCGL